MIELSTPNGLSAWVPEHEAEDPSPHFSVGDLPAISAYYEANGYVVVKGALDPSICDEVRGHWNREIKPSSHPIYRQQTSKLECNRFNSQGWVMNPILNPQSVDPRQFPLFRQAARNQVLNSPRYAEILRHIFGERPKVVQAMYFEGNSETWEHQDSYYLDSEKIGSLVGVWFALEDIEPQAGRFFICPRTHLLDWPKRHLKNNVVDGHVPYIESVIDTYLKSSSTIRSPALKKGDAIIWNSCTIHGSLGTQDALHSRSAITCHAIPVSHKFLQLHKKISDVPAEDLGNVYLHAPKDLARVQYRVVKWCELTFPRLFWDFKKAWRRVEIRFEMLRELGISARTPIRPKAMGS